MGFIKKFIAVYVTGMVVSFSGCIHQINTEKEKCRIQGIKRDQSGDIAIVPCTLFWPIGIYDLLRR